MKVCHDKNILPLLTYCTQVMKCMRLSVCEMSVHHVRPCVCVCVSDECVCLCVCVCDECVCLCVCDECVCLCVCV